MQTLTKTLSAQNNSKKPMTDTQLTSLNHGLLRIDSTFEQLADFISAKAKKEPVLKSFPINATLVAQWKVDLGLSKYQDIKKYLNKK